MKFYQFIKNIDYKRIGYHVLFWVVISVFYDAVSSIVSGRPFFEMLAHDFKFFFPSDVLGVYITLYILIPGLLLKRKYTQFIIFSVLFLGFLIIVITLPLQYLGLFLEYQEKFLEAGRLFPTLYDYTGHNFLVALTVKLMIIGIASSIKIAKNWFKSQKRQQNLLKEKFEVNLQLKEAELKFLKSQINPHFLFNALNNLYSLTLEKSPKAPEVVLKISSLLDYVLYECNVPKIDLDREIENIKNYIDLQKIRYGNDTNIKLNVEGDTSDIQIAPLLILPLVENAFKHGLDKNVGKGYIYIDIKVADDATLDLSVKNSLKGENNHEGDGIGLTNLRKRLELQYPDKHNFSLLLTDESCISDLKLKLY